MPLRVTFELTDADLRHFQLIMREARNASANISREDILDSAKKLLDEVRGSKVPEFIGERLEKLETMINMVTDPEWQLPDKETTRALNALAYFGEPEDLIPDHIPGLGFLDDAIMVELVVRELKHEIEAYEDFCRFRSREEQRKVAEDPSVTREAWLTTRRQELHSRMRRRRRSDRSRRSKRGTRTKSPFSLL